MNAKSNEESQNFLKSFEQSLLNDGEFAAQYLESRGFNPVEEGKNIKNFVSKLLVKKKAEFKRISLTKAYDRAKDLLKKLSNATESEFLDLQSIFNEKMASKYALNFKDLKKMDQKDAIKILTDIEILEFLEKEFGKKNDDSKN